jgi:hypothetical protein
MRLGWRNPRPNDFQTPDLRPLRDMFGNLQQFMTWPHFTATIDSGQSASNGGFAKRTITPVDDPYSIIRNASDDFVVPYEFDTWMMFARAHVIIDTGGAGLYQIGFNLNTVNVEDLIEDAYSAGAVPQRAHVDGWKPVRKGDVIHVRTNAPAAVNILTGGYLACFFLPMT